MNARAWRYRSWAIVVFGLACLAIGMASALVSNPMPASAPRTALRLAALLLGMVAFISQMRFEVIRLQRAPRVAALKVSSAIALGVFLLAVFANICAWKASSSSPSLLLALLIWPAVSGVLAFLVALPAGMAWGRLPQRGDGAGGIGS
jgi:hypothetical protein